ncbi:MAG: molybdopterin-containing oxidoreductase family protein [Ignavibacteriales bacterium]
MSERIVTSACPLNCTDVCTYRVVVRDGVAVDIRADKDHEMLHGIICAKAKKQLRRVYDHERLLHPMLKTASGWKRIPWADAASILGERLSAAVATHGPESVFLYYEWGSRGVLKGLERRFFNSLGGVTEPSGSLCWAAGTAAQEYDFGSYLAHDPSDFPNTRLAIIWGRNPAVSNIHSVPFLKEARRRGARIVVIDPAPTPTSSFADLHIAPRPGTDGALALGMAHVVIEEGLADHAFIERHTYGFDLYRQVVKAFTPEEASRICDVAPETIRDLARAYASAKPAMLLIGYGVQHYYNGGHTVRAIDALAALTGNIGVPGGGANYGSSATAGWIAPVDGSPGAGPRRLFPRPVMADRILECNGPDRTSAPVEVLVVSRANPVNQVPDSTRTLQALSSIPFKVTIELRMSETALQSDLVLPATTWLEECDIMTSSWHNYVTYTQQAIEPRGEAMHEKDIFALVAGTMGMETDLDRPFDYWADIALRPLNQFGIDAVTLKGRSIRVPAAPVVAWEDRRFLTPTGLYEFYSLKAEREGLDPLPRWVAPLEATTADPEYPFTVVNSREATHMHSQFADSILRDGRSPILMPRGAATAAGIGDGEGISLVTRARGSMRGVAVLVDGLRNDTIVVFEGTSVAGGNGVNLITPAVLTDFGLGSAYNDCRVKVVRDGASDRS